MPTAAVRRLAAPLAQALALAGSAHAAAPQVRTQGPGFYRMMLGQFEVTVLSDGTHPLPVNTVMTGTTPRAIDAALAREALHQPIQGSINAFLINTGDKLVLIDSGAGVLYGVCCGKLAAHLRAAGYDPAQVDLVLLTHLHKDHVGGIAPGGRAAFPNAVVRAALLERAAREHLWIGAAHIAFPDLGHLRREGRRYAWIPANYEGDPGTPP